MILAILFGVLLGAVGTGLLTVLYLDGKGPSVVRWFYLLAALATVALIVLLVLLTE